MRSLICVVSGLCLFLPAAAQPPKQGYQVPAPEGWTKETIPLPPTFAPDMKWKGVEELRFAPGMYKPESDSFFSYAILFWLPGEQKVDAKTMEQEMLVYYKGLCQAVSKGKNKNVDVSTFSVKIKDVTPPKASVRPTGELYYEYTGELLWIEPFVTSKPQTLQLDIHTWYCDKHKHHCVFMCVSPQPKTATVWKTMQEIRTKTTCH